MDNNSSKFIELKKLGLQRKRNCYPGYYQIFQFYNSKYESDFVSPYTKSAGNVNAQIIVLLQDWSSKESLSKPFDPVTAQYGYTPNIPTNINLKKLLQEVFTLRLSE